MRNIISHNARARIVRAAMIALGGCALGISMVGCGGAYSTPGQAADYRAMGITRETQTDATVKSTLDRKPLASFPTSIAAVRVQAPDYYSPSDERFGQGNYCVITTRNVESDIDFDRLGKLPMVRGVGTINHVLLPRQLNSDMELRQAAASLHADILLIYTIDTGVKVEDHLLPLTVATIGLSPDMTAQIVTTASAILMDTRNGYIYGTAEATEHGTQLTSGWTAEAAVHDARRRTEGQAFAKLVDNLQITWDGVVKNYANVPTTQSDAK